MTGISKWAAATVGVASVALATGCAGPGASTSTSTSSGGASSSSSSAAMGKIVYIPGLTGNPFYNTVSCGAKTEASKLGVDFSYQGAPTFGVPEQTKILNAVVATKPGAIMISITDPTAMIGPLTAAKQAGVKIIGIDGDLSDTSIMTTNIQSDGVQGGGLAGDALAKAVGEKGTVLIIDNATGSVVSKARTDGFQKAIAKYPNMKVLPIQFSANDVSKAASIVSTTAATNADLVGVFGAETNNTTGALTGVREAGKSGKVKVVGYDTSEPIVAALKDGSLTGTVVQFPRGEGATGVDSAVAAMQGKSVPRNQAADAIFVTPETVNSDKAKQYIYDVNCSG
ncbi:ribose transport system substrate-binding protein [Phycicoccus badiiscoriae]|uniref:Ribose transport system substrate-binding protein n=1 Tax=Pedococcus badiiscoriae TaxID=642776 RepID=A0A852WDL1_9MICO|nr:ABC transporter substrate-binding protein [Pedococcus badiiscoriae]NYG06790.1 ribose transport system substrate-binding protein [Pedococcus badiiscoriae]